MEITGSVAGAERVSAVVRSDDGLTGRYYGTVVDGAFSIVVPETGDDEYAVITAAGPQAVTRWVVDVPAGDGPQAVTSLVKDLPYLPPPEDPPLTAGRLFTPSVWPPVRLTSSVLSLFQSGHGWSTSGTPGSSELNDTASYCRGTQSARITTNGSGVNCGIQRLGGTAVDLTGKAIRLTFKVDSPSRIGNLNFFAGTASLANNFKWRFDAETASNRVAIGSEWIQVTLTWAELNSASGTMSITAGVPSTTAGFTDFRFEASDASAGALTVNLQAIEIVPDSKSRYPSGVVSLTFDDGYASVYQFARPVMDAYGFSGTCYAIVEPLGTSGYMTKANLTSLQGDAGWEIGGHAYYSATHTGRYTALTAAEARRDLELLREWLIENGFTGDSFAYPGGQFGMTTDGVPVDELVRECFSSGRTILSTVGVSTHTCVDNIPPAMPYRLRGLSSISSLSTAPSTAAALVATGGMLDKIAANGGWLDLVFHRFVASSPSTTAEITQADFATIVAAIAAKGIAVRTVGEVMRGASV